MKVPALLLPWWNKLTATTSSHQLRLSHNNIFLWPSRYGVSWLVMAAILFLFGVNYQHNLVIGFSFFLVSLFVTNLIYSYRNLAGLRLSAQPPSYAFAGDEVHFYIKLESRRPRYGLTLAIQQQQRCPITDIEAGHTIIELSQSTHRRGLLTPNPVIIESRFPLGLCRARAKFSSKMSQIIWAKPDAHLPQTLANPLTSVEQQDLTFTELRSYQRGQSKSRIAWKQVAQQKGWYSKHFDMEGSSDITLVLEQMPATSYEQRIAQLSGLIEWHSRASHSFSVQAGATQISANSGEAHRIHCQNLLAALPKTAEDA
ncbi:DUF58 domain-containing protein [Paraferrimonas haliotis]|uniref:DUF58 domain-containing protein n=1 Tax=Paraferrimonas haliotis TaxID=2013866 RepID=A0AA37WXJ9_9GAMM|nr:DUF58 domain-containing protein [Paraferrimonas haliotis]GLS84723.1 DUF58 domain-containing protein [Paraferrimonas haliotis]